VAEYSFFSSWQLTAPIERVWDELSRVEHWPEWWTYVVRVEQLTPGSEPGVGALYRMRWKTALPYTFFFEVRTTSFERPRLYEAVSAGELDGRGRYELYEHAGITTIHYYWTARTTKLWMNLLAPLARSAFAWNHAVLMQAGGEGLAKRLGVRLVGNRSYTEESSSPLVPLFTVAGLIALLATVMRWARRVWP
jgi:polyketide cyclase/dehydrase/lipid transport protein